MGRPPPTKTFDLRTPTDLYEKLIFDIERLRAARSSVEARYAAVDCSVTSLHLADWVLHAVSDERHKELSGQIRNHKHAVAGFAKLQAAKLPDLEYCYPIGNSVKHRELRNDKSPSLWTGTTSRLIWSEPTEDTGKRSITGVKLITYFKLDGERYNAIELFEAMASQWRSFLIEEGLFEFRPEPPEDE
jgi:hypothetical protein